MKKAKRNILIATVLVFVCAAVYLNWSYNRADESEPVGAEDGAGDQQSVSAGSEDSDYFAQARLTRQTSRDEALSLLETAAASESASQETIDGAMDAIAAMATWSMQETQIENLLLAKNFEDCVVYISSDGVTVAVPAPVEGLSAASVAQITETIIGETGCTAEDIRVIEVKGGSSGTSITDTDETDAGAKASPSPSASPAPSPSASPAAE
ncbi:MAG TPA: SpoIIIAH-like family protein [Candidatus Scatomorpha gallistercoris]|nr:SpoIIIAH-like family protein [Candidatus Scatomorpha gallistercoris]